MGAAVYLALLLSGAFGYAAPGLARTQPPAVATWFLSVGALVAACGSSASLGLLAFHAIARAPGMAAAGGWSVAMLRVHDPAAVPVGLVATTAVLVLAVRFGRAAIRRLAAVRDAYRLAADLPDTGAALTVLESDTAQAFAVPGRPGRIVISAGLLSRLDAAQRRALLAHEQSHLAHRHHLHRAAAHLAASVNPLLTRLSGAVALSCERWADEDAAGAAGRRTAADTLTRAATGALSGVQGGALTPGVALAAGVTEVSDRVVALLRPAPPVSWWRVLLLTSLLAATAVAVAAALSDTEYIFELAQTAYRTAHH